MYIQRPIIIKAHTYKDFHNSIDKY